MDAIEALLTRRSIRKFTEEEVSEEDLTILLKCAMSAPSAKNEQPWQFIIVTDKALRAELSLTTPYTHMAAGAPAVIVVCGDLNEDKSGGFWPQDCAAAIENLLLAARARNLGSVWCGVYPKEDRVAKLSKTLGLPDHVIPLGLLCIGHPDQKFGEANRFKPERIHRNKW